MLERKQGVPVAPAKLDVPKITDDIRTVQCNLFQEIHYAYASWVITSDRVRIWNR